MPENTGFGFLVMWCYKTCDLFQDIFHSYCEFTSGELASVVQAPPGFPVKMKSQRYFRQLEIEPGLWPEAEFGIITAVGVESQLWPYSQVPGKSTGLREIFNVLIICTDIHKIVVGKHNLAL